jgi:hypothetical protein
MGRSIVKVRLRHLAVEFDVWDLLHSSNDISEPAIAEPCEILGVE